MSTEVPQELKYIPAEVKVVKHIRHVYSGRHCEREEIETPVQTASKPKPPIPSGLASSSLLAHIMNQKYVEGLPHFISKRKKWNRMGLELSRQTMANWMIYTAEHGWKNTMIACINCFWSWISFVRMKQLSDYVWTRPANQNPIYGFIEQEKKGRRSSCTIFGKREQEKIRKKFLEGFQGYLQVYGYAGYHKFENVTLVGCWAHARRKFTDALKSVSANSPKPVTATEGLHFCNQLFAIERKLKDLEPQVRHDKRIEQSKPVLDAFLSWLKIHEQKVLPKSNLGDAIAYCLNQWDKLVAF